MEQKHKVNLWHTFWRGTGIKTIWNRATGLIREEKGDLVSSLGWMAIMALALVIIKGIVDGKLVSYVNTVFVHLDRLFNV